MSAQVACLTEDVAVASALRVELYAADGGLVEVAVVRDEDGELHAISDICSHGQVSLSDGEIEGCTVECWLHGSRFDLRTGAPIGLPATKSVPTYPVTVIGDDVFLKVES